MSEIQVKQPHLMIFGSGGFGREVAWAAEQTLESSRGTQLACFVDDDESQHGTYKNGLPIISFTEALKTAPDAFIALAVGSPRGRQKIAERCAAAGFKFATVIHNSVHMSRFVEIGEGAIICAGSTLTTNIKLGRQVHINLHCTIGHDVILGDFTTLAPGVHVSGWVHFGKRVYVGTGAVFVNGTEGKPLLIGDDAVIGAEACVTKEVPAGETWVGVPARRRV